MNMLDLASVRDAGAVAGLGDARCLDRGRLEGAVEARVATECRAACSTAAGLLGTLSCLKKGCPTRLWAQNMTVWKFLRTSSVPTHLLERTHGKTISFSRVVRITSTTNFSTLPTFLRTCLSL